MTDETTANPKQLVAGGYDRIWETYAGIAPDPLRHQYIEGAITRLGDGRPLTALDLGCGTGKHATALLVERGLDVTGVDISPRSIEVVRHEVPGAKFLVGDMATVDLPPGVFDLVTALYSIIHVPRDEHPAILRRVVEWLRPGGLLVATLAGGEHPGSGTEEAWLGVAPMYWSNFDATTNRRIVAEAGLKVLSAKVEPVMQGGIDRHGFLWVIARKPENPGPA